MTLRCSMSVGDRCRKDSGFFVAMFTLTVRSMLPLSFFVMALLLLLLLLLMALKSLVLIVLVLGLLEVLGGSFEYSHFRSVAVLAVCCWLFGPITSCSSAARRYLFVRPLRRSWILVGCVGPKICQHMLTKANIGPAKTEFSPAPYTHIIQEPVKNNVSLEFQKEFPTQLPLWLPW